MNLPTSRRWLLASGAALGAVPLLPATVRAETAPKRLVAGTGSLEVDGKPARVFRLTGPDGRPGITLEPGERFAVDLVNQAGGRTIIHWHGQLPPWTDDGFPWPQTPPIAPGATKSYDFAPIPGTFWMHSHQGLQEQGLMAAPLIVRDAAELREDRQDIVLLLHDFSFRAPDELLAGLIRTTPEQAHAMARQIENLSSPQPPSRSAGQSGMTAMPMNGMHMGSGMAMDLNDIAYDAYLANDRTLSDPEIVRVGKGGRLRLRIINGASASQFWIDLGSLAGRVVAADGHPVHPVPGSRFPIAIAQRLDILIDLPRHGAFPVLAQVEGRRDRAGIVLATQGARIGRIAALAPHPAKPVDNTLEARLSAMRPIRPRRPDRVHRIVLSGRMTPFAWALNGQYWPKIEPLMLTKGQRVEIELVNRSMMAHPMHLHGHAFQVIALDGKPIAGAVRDTVLVQPRMGSVRIAFDADNLGRWAFHCHNLYHMMTGMMMEFRYHGIV
ncbi:multicopper oxidase family protein [Acidiphilium iwatense]|uniref:Multicopper oxidase family protein n=1 Tax=Acidiphilium iwatense TaxID=768198 RepID=A0ABS9DV97_9PROT|nr:multicopper oxidase family protein [Acidiphilium iwatense]MCF3945685.1 multicopper oxidase family protein [Acidiphilium iwatense]